MLIYGKGVRRQDCTLNYSQSDPPPNNFLQKYCDRVYLFFLNISTNKNKEITNGYYGVNNAHSSG
jgi:hypothetical protein